MSRCIVFHTCVACRIVASANHTFSSPRKQPTRHRYKKWMLASVPTNFSVSLVGTPSFRSTGSSGFAYIFIFLSIVIRWSFEGADDNSINWKTKQYIIWHRKLKAKHRRWKAVRQGGKAKRDDYTSNKSNSSNMS